MNNEFKQKKVSGEFEVSVSGGFKMYARVTESDYDTDGSAYIFVRIHTLAPHPNNMFWKTDSLELVSRSESLEGFVEDYCNQDLKESPCRAHNHQHVTRVECMHSPARSRQDFREDVIRLTEGARGNSI